MKNMILTDKPPLGENETKLIIKLKHVFCKLQNSHQAIIGGDVIQYTQKRVNPISDNKTKMWEKIIDKVKQRDLDVFGYMYFVFKTVYQDCDVVYPNQLLSEAFLDLYQAVQQTYHEAVRVEWTCEIEKFRMECEKFDIVAQYAEMTLLQKKQFTLLNNAISFSKLFLYCQAYVCNLPQLCRKIQDDAILQYVLFSGIYDELIQSASLKQSLHQLADDI
jgi:hypothetical protein